MSDDAPSATANQSSPLAVFVATCVCVWFHVAFDFHLESKHCLVCIFAYLVVFDLHQDRATGPLDWGPCGPLFPTSWVGGSKARGNRRRPARGTQWEKGRGEHAFHFLPPPFLFVSFRLSVFCFLYFFAAFFCLFRGMRNEIRAPHLCVLRTLGVLALILFIFIFFGGWGSIGRAGDRALRQQGKNKETQKRGNKKEQEQQKTKKERNEKTK